MFVITSGLLSARNQRWITTQKWSGAKNAGKTEDSNLGMTNFGLIIRVIGHEY